VGGRAALLTQPGSTDHILNSRTLAFRSIFSVAACVFRLNYVTINEYDTTWLAEFVLIL